MIRFVLGVVMIFAALPARAEIDIKEVTSPGGITAWLVEEPSIPFVALELRFRGGGTLDLPGKRGATNLMVGLLEEGTGDMDARDFAKATEELAEPTVWEMFVSRIEPELPARASRRNTTTVNTATGIEVLIVKPDIRPR